MLRRFDRLAPRVGAEPFWEWVRVIRNVTGCFFLGSIHSGGVRHADRATPAAPELPVPETEKMAERQAMIPVP